LIRWQINHKWSSYEVPGWISAKAPVRLDSPPWPFSHDGVSATVYAEDANVEWRRDGQYLDEPRGGNHDGFVNELMFDGSVHQWNARAWWEKAGA